MSKHLKSLAALAYRMRNTALTRAGALVLAAALAVLPLAATHGAAQAEDMSKDAIEKIVHDYIMEHPEIIRDAIAELDRREQVAADEARQKALTDNADVLTQSPYQVVIGNPKGDVTLVEFFDYNCGYCKRAYGDLAKLMDEDKNLRVVLKEFPVLGKESVEAAQVAVAVNEVAPEKYAEFHENLLLSRGRANFASAMDAATGVGIDADALQKVIKTDLAQKTIEEVYSLGNNLNLTGTPSYVIGDEVVPGAIGYDGLKSKIDALRNCGTTTC